MDVLQNVLLTVLGLWVAYLMRQVGRLRALAPTRCGSCHGDVAVERRLCRCDWVMDHPFVPGFDPFECGHITEGATWTTADPYHCRKPRSLHRVG